MYNDIEKVLITVPHKTYVPNKGMGPINKPYYVDLDLLKLYDLMNIQYKKVNNTDYVDINEDGEYDIQEFRSVEDYIEQKYLQVNEIFKQIKIMARDSDDINKDSEDKFSQIRNNLVDTEELNGYLSELDKFKYNIEDKKLDLQFEKEDVVSIINEMNLKLDNMKESLTSFDTIRDQFNSNYNNTLSLNDEMQSLSETANYIKGMNSDVIKVEEKLNLIKDKSEELKLSQEAFNTSITDFESNLLDYKENLKNYMTENAEMYKGDKGIQGVQGEKGESFKYSDFTEEQLALLKGEKGDKFTYEDFTEDQLALLKGEKGDKGESFKYSDFTEGQLNLLKGEKGDQGEKGETGEQGISVPPKVFTRDEYDALTEKDPNTLYFII